MTVVFKDFLGSGFQTLADKRQIQVICSTGGVDRMGDVVDQNGIDLSAYRSNPVVLFGHNPNMPIARALDIGVVDGKLRATCQFPPPGVSPKADEVLGLVQAGIVNGVSIGFKPLKTEPMEKGNPRGPQRYVKSALQEFSIVTVPANAEALITGRSAGSSSTSLHDSDRARRLREIEVMNLLPISVEIEEEEAARAKRLRQVEIMRLIASKA